MSIHSTNRVAGPHDGAPAALVLCSRDGVIQMADIQMQIWHGWTCSALVGKHISTVLPDAASIVEDGVWYRVPVRDGEGLRVDAQAYRTILRDARDAGLIAWRISHTGHQDPDVTELVTAVVRSTGEAVITKTLDGVVTSWNGAAERLYGFPAARMIGQPAEILFPAEAREEEKQILKRVSHGETVEHHRIVRLHADGSRLTVELTATPLTDQQGRTIGALTVSRDAGERLRAEQQFRDLIEAAPDGIVGVDERGTIVQVNRTAERLFGYPRHKMIGQAVELLVPVPARAQHEEHRRKFFAEPNTRTMGMGRQLWGRRSDGSTFPAEISIAPVKGGDGLVAVTVIRDRTAVLATAARLLAMPEDATGAGFQTQLLRAQRMDTLGHLAGGIAHDFNNLLAVILNYATFIVEDEVDEVGGGLDLLRNDAQQIIRAAQYGSQLTGQLLAFARREITRPEPVALNVLVHEIRPMLVRTLGERIELTTALAADLPAVTADACQVEQMLLNLAVNARDAMPHGGSLTISTAAVTAEATLRPQGPPIRPGEYVAVRVADTGTGMPPEIMERAFDPFFTTKPPGQGTGLGLAMIYGIMTQANGTITIESEPGHGTTMSLLFPTTSRHPQAAAPRPQKVSDLLGAGEKILLVEANPALRAACHRILARAGYSVVSPQTPTAIKHTAEHFDLVLTDVAMPEILGVDLADQLVFERRTHRVLYMTGHAGQAFGAEGSAPTDTAILQKPFTPAELLSAVHAALRSEPLIPFGE